MYLFILQIEATLQALDPNGFTDNYVLTEGSGKLFFILSNQAHKVTEFWIFFCV